MCFSSLHNDVLDGWSFYVPGDLYVASKRSWVRGVLLPQLWLLGVDARHVEVQEKSLNISSVYFGT